MQSHGGPQGRPVSLPFVCPRRSAPPRLSRPMRSVPWKLPARSTLHGAQGRRGRGAHVSSVQKAAPAEGLPGDAGRRSSRGAAGAQQAAPVHLHLAVTLQRVVAREGERLVGIRLLCGGGCRVWHAAVSCCLLARRSAGSPDQVPPTLCPALSPSTSPSRTHDGGAAARGRRATLRAAHAGGVERNGDALLGDVQLDLLSVEGWERGRVTRWEPREQRG